MAEKDELLEVILNQADTLCRAIVTKEGAEIFFGDDEWEAATSELRENIAKFRKLRAESN